jgi:hypothetical protein
MASGRSYKHDRCGRFFASQPQRQEDEADVKRSHGEKKPIDMNSGKKKPV